MTEIRRIGVLTSGGDCAGLNAVLRAITYRAIDGYGWEVLGIRNGTAGLLERPVLADRLTTGHFPGTLLRMGGTVLGTTNKGDPFNFPDADGGMLDEHVSKQYDHSYRIWALLFLELWHRMFIDGTVSPPVNDH